MLQFTIEDKNTDSRDYAEDINESDKRKKIIIFHGPRLVIFQ